MTILAYHGPTLATIWPRSEAKEFIQPMSASTAMRIPYQYQEQISLWGFLAHAESLSLQPGTLTNLNDSVKPTVSWSRDIPIPLRG